MKREPRLRNGVIYENIYEIVTYDDSENLNTEVIIKFIKAKFPDADMVYILHDKDVNDDGTPKKPHTHIIIRFKREKSINVLAKELGIETHNIEWKASWVGTIQYLIHQNAPNKYQYDKTLIVANCDISDCFTSKDDKESRRQQSEEREMTELSVIMKYIASRNGMLTLFEVYQFCIDNQIWSTYRRNYSIIKDMIIEGKEHFKRKSDSTYWYITL